MKKTILVMTLLLSGFAFQNASAQVRLNINIGVQPVWGPVGYDHAEYYYMPDIDAYYYIPNRQFIYMEHGRWAFSTYLPSRFNYDIYSGYKVVVNEPYPYRNAEMYRTRYASYRGNHEQQIIRNSHEEKYFENKDHPEHSKWNNGNNRDYRNNGDNQDNRNKRGKGHDRRD
jgi:hypothetical protein